MKIFINNTIYDFNMIYYKIGYKEDDWSKGIEYIDLMGMFSGGQSTGYNITRFFDMTEKEINNIMLDIAVEKEIYLFE